ncbi:MAG: BspA family leucine-rich repeat surface protein [Erysipelotrichaceae bacterium]|nr:BspA family leucine-rich repeat surface protein [Erysipelotrichaceae bacterium]
MKRILTILSVFLLCVSLLSVKIISAEEDAATNTLSEAVEENASKEETVQQDVTTETMDEDAIEENKTETIVSDNDVSNENIMEINVEEADESVLNDETIDNSIRQEETTDSISEDLPVELDETSTTGDAYAILANNGDFVFFRSTTSYNNGSTYSVTINGTSYRGTVYSGIEMLQATYDGVTCTTPWRNKISSIKKVYVANGQTISPISMAYWFLSCTNMTSFDGTGFDTSNVTDMSWMFAFCSSLTSVNVSGFDTSNVTDMNLLFDGCSSLTTVDVSGFNTSSVADMSQMFHGCSSLTAVDVSGFDTSSVVYMLYMFSGCSSLTSLDLSGFNTSSVTDTGYMFNDCSSLTSLDISGFVTSNVSYMAYMFNGCSSLTAVDVSGFDTSSVVYMLNMFSGCSSLASLDLSSFDTSNVSYMRNMFDGCSVLDTVILGSKFTRWLDNSYLPSGSWYHENPNLVKDEYELCNQFPSHAAEWAGTWTRKGFAYAILTNNRELIFFRSGTSYTNGSTYTVTIDGTSYTGTVYSGFEALSATSYNSIPWYSNRQLINKVYVVNGQTINPVSTTYWFYECSNITSFNATGFNTSNVTNMGSMFYGCSSLTSLDLSGFDTSEVTNMSGIFYDCSSLTSLDMSDFDTSKVTHMRRMFWNCSSLTSLDLNSFDTSCVEDMESMFSGCSSLTSLDLSHFDTSNVTRMQGYDYLYGMFSGCSSLTSLDLSHFDTSNVGDMASMFSGCSSLASLNLSSFNTSNVVDMYNMFSGCSSLASLDLSGFDTSNVQGMDRMFYNCSSLVSLDLSSFDTSKVTDAEMMMDMFYGCSSLETIKLGSGFTNWIDNAYLPTGNWLHEEPDLVKTEVELYNQYPSHAAEWAGIWTRDMSRVGSAYAILADDGDFIFFRSETPYTNGSSCTVVINGVSYTGTVYSGIEDLSVDDNYDIPWYSKTGTIKKTYVAEGYTIKPVSMAYWFYDCTEMTSFDGDGFDTSCVTGMNFLFYNCRLMTETDLSDFDTSSVEDMGWMFYDCESLAFFDLEGFVTSNVENMGSMFSHCLSAVSLDVDGFDTSKVRSMSSMFAYCNLLESLDLSHFNTLSVQSMDSMFAGLPAMTSLDLSNFNTSAVQNMSSMFSNSGFLVSLDLSSFNTSSVTNMRMMFNGCLSLAEVKFGPSFSKWIQNAYLPSGSWALKNSSLVKTETELYNEYPSHAQEWAGTWIKITPVSSVSLNKNSLNIKVNASEALTVTVLPEDATIRDVVWSSSDSTVASVNQNGLVTALQAGTAIITVTTTDGTNLSAQCEVTVEENVPTDGTAYAVLTDNGNLIFFRSFETYTNGVNTTAKDIYNNTYTGIVYTGIETANFEESSQVPWLSDPGSIGSSYVAPVQIISPISTAFWFYNCSNMTSVDLSGLDTSNATYMHCMFYGCSSLTSLDLSNFSTSDVIYMDSLFSGCSSLTSIDLSSFDTSAATNMADMFKDCSALISVKFGTEFTKWIQNAYLPTGTWFNLEKNLHKTETELYDSYPANASAWSGTWIKGMLASSISLNNDSLIMKVDDSETLIATVLPEDAAFKDVAWNSSDPTIASVDQNGLVTALSTGTAIITATTTDGTDLSAQCEVTVEEIQPTDGTAYALLTNRGDLIFFRSFSTYTNRTSTTVEDIYGNTYTGTVYTGVESGNNYWLSDSDSVKSVYVAPNQTIKPAYTAYWFRDCSNMTSFDATGFDTSNDRNMSYMFLYCSSLSSLYLSGFDTSNVTDMREMFSGCSALTSLDLSSFDTSKVTNMTSMFYRCSALTSLDLSSFNTTLVTTGMANMFYGCSSLPSLDLSSFNTLNVTDMSSMFEGCSSLSSVDLSGFVTSQVTDMSLMFYECSSLASIDLSSFNTSNVTNMRGMFDNDSALTTLDLSSFDTSKVTDMYGIVSHCSSLVSLDLSSFNTSNVANMKTMFRDCSSLASVKLGADFTKWIDNAYLPSGTWYNFEKELHKTEIELYNNYPSNASDWAGTWIKGTDVSSVSLNKTSLNMKVGASETLTATVLPEDATNKELVWSSLDPTIASVDQNGLVTAMKVGITIIKATTTDGTNLSAQCGVTVEKADATDGIAYAVLTSDGDLIFFKSFETYTNGEEISARDIHNNSYIGTVYSGIETDVYDLSVPWYSQQESIIKAYVAPDQMIKPKSTAYWFNDCEAMTSIALSGFDTSDVTDMRDMFHGCESLTSLDLSSLNTTKVADTTAMFYGCTSLESLDLSSFNTSNVERMEDMFLDCPSLTSVKLGTGFTTWNDNAYLPEGTWHNFDKNLHITETELYSSYPRNASVWSGTWVRRTLLSSVALNEHELTMIISDTESLSATIQPEDATIKDLEWSSSKPAIVSVDQEGNIVALALGEAVITVSATDGSGLSDSCTVKVVEMMLHFEEKNLTIIPQDSKQLTVAIRPESQSGRKVVYESSDPSILSVDEEGVITGIKAGKATVTAYLEEYEEASDTCEVRVLFKDVAVSTSYFFNPVYWAFDNGITTGTSPTTFSPDDPCTRGQVVTFLWRTLGCPEPVSENPFKDVSEGKFYYKAVIWAFENGITTGTSKTTFSPNDKCTREQIVTFLYRTAKYANGGNDPEYVSKDMNFSDVLVSNYFYEPVHWAFSTGITTGISSTKFGVGNDCIRAMVVTFLKRYDDAY